MNGIRVAKSGFKATDTDFRHLVFDSTLNTFKYIKHGQLGPINVTAPYPGGGAAGTSNATYTIDHNLGYVPSFDIYVLDQGIMSQPTWDNVSGPVIIPRCTPSQLILHVYSVRTSNTGFYIYYLLGAEDLDSSDA